MNSHVLSFSAIFNYGPLARASRGVFIPATLAAGTTSTWEIDIRIDSASTYSVFGRQWAQMLGLNWEAGDPLTIMTAAGLFQARLHEVTIYLLDWEWTSWVAFAEWDTVPPSPARDVLGLTGFFDHFLVGIDDASEMIYLEPRF